MNSTVITVQWDGPNSCRHVNGLIVLYRVQYTEVASGVVQSKNVTGDRNIVNAVTSLTGLIPSTNYSIQVAAVNEEGDVGLYSDPLIKHTSKFNIHIPCPISKYSQICNIFVVSVQLSVTVDTTTATSISLSWTSAGSEVDGYAVMWTSHECPSDVDEGSATITDITETSYIIEGLREGTSYTITVSATTSAVTLSSDTVTGDTQELGQCPLFQKKNPVMFLLPSSSICCSHFCDNIQ